MNKIILDGYNPLIQNEVYERRKELGDAAVEDIPVVKIVRLARFKVPSREDVIDFIRLGANDSQHDRTEKDLDSKVYSRMVEIMRTIHPSELGYIARGDKDVLDHLRKHYMDSGLIEGASYLEALSGSIPEIIMDLAIHLAGHKGVDAYEEAIGRESKDGWSLRIRLNENNRLPEKSELEYLTRRGVRDCDVFSAVGDFGNYSDVASRVMGLYNSVGQNGLILNVTDNSRKFLEVRAAYTFAEFAKCVAASSMAERINGMVREAAEEGRDEDMFSDDFPYSN